MNVFVLEYGQDDPAKCTARKMVRMELATSVSRRFHASNSILVLNPYADTVLLPEDRASKGILVVDCSWNLAREVFFRRIGGKHRRLPALLAANPTNYAKLGRLSSVEAAAASLYLMGQDGDAKRCLSIYKWGDTFLTLNKEPLEEYSRARSESQVREIERSFFPQLAET